MYSEKFEEVMMRRNNQINIKYGKTGHRKQKVR